MSRQVKWTITSMPMLKMSYPSTSGLSEGLPPGLSVIDTADIRPSSNASLAMPVTASTARPVGLAPRHQFPG